MNLITKIPSAREECTRFIYVVRVLPAGAEHSYRVIHTRALQILLQHAGIVNMLSAPALAGFRSSMTEWRSQLQQLQDAPSISMFKKVPWRSCTMCCVLVLLLTSAVIYHESCTLPGGPHLPRLCSA